MFLSSLGRVAGSCVALWVAMAGLLMGVPTRAQAQFITGTYNGQISIGGYSGPGGDVVIPDTINGLPVTSISNWAFYYRYGLTSVTIPSSVTRIGAGAFVECTGLTSLTIPSSVASIDNAAFEYCTRLTTLTIPSGLTSISDYLCYGCSGLTSVTIPSSIISIGSVAFYGCSGLTSLTIPSNVTSIGGGAFYGCTSLTSLSIPSSVTSIGRGAFSGCSGLTSLSIPSSITSLDDGAFSGCSGLTSLSIPSSITSLGNGAFYGCSGLTSLTIPSNITSIGGGAFHGCSGLTSLTIPSSVASIGSNAFENCTGLTTLTLPSGLASISDYTFNGCTGLTSITLPSHITSIGYFAFAGCTGLTSISIPSNVTSLGSYAFSGCTNLRSIFMKGNAPSLGQNPFLSDTSATIYYVAGTAGWTGTFGGCPTVALYSPLVFTGSASGVDDSSALLSGTLNPNGFPTVARFEYGLTDSYGASVDVTLSPDNGSTFQSVSASLAGLQPGMVYHYRLTGSNSQGALEGNDYTFTTMGIPAVTAGTATMKNPNSESLQGTVNPCGLATTAWIEYGLTSAYGNSVNVPLSASAGSSPQTVSINIDGLQPGTTYHYRLSGSNSAGLNSTPDQTFTTQELLSYASDGSRGLKVTKCNALGGEVTVPSTINGLPVTTIGYTAFWTTAVTSVIISPGITSIENSAFAGCVKLTNVSIPDSVTSIGSEAFSNCQGLSSVTLPPNLTSLGSYAFEQCTALTSISIPSGVKGLYGAFVGCTKLSNVTLNPGLTTLDMAAFSGCSSLTSLALPSTLTKIGDRCFYHTGLTTIEIPSGVTSIGNSAFEGCTALQSVTIPSGVTSIGGNAFYGCTSLSNVTIPASVTSLGDGAFGSCTQLKGVYFQGNAPSLGYSGPFNLSNNASIYYLAGATGWGTTFAGRPAYLFDPQVPFLYATTNGSITVTKYIGLGGGAVTIPDTINHLPVTAIQDEAFLGCSSVTSVSFPSTLTSIGYGAFHNCTGLTALSFPSSLTSIGSVAFEGCTGLTNITLPSSVTGLGSAVFSGCSNLTGITLSPNLSSLGDGLFFGCSALTSIEIPAGVTSLGNSVFSGCSSLTSVTIPSGVTTIGDAAFKGCSGLTSLEIPAGVTYLGSSVFSGCSALSSVNVPAGLGVIRAETFEGCTGLTSLTLPDDITEIQGSAFKGCSGLNTLTLPSGVSKVGDFGFANCAGLTSLYFQGNAPSLGNSSFDSDPNLTVYWRADTTGWTSSFGGCPTATIFVPVLFTNPASSVDATSAILSGTVNPDGLQTVAQFEYGFTTAYGSTATVALSPANGAGPQAISVSLTGLQRGTIYHYRLTGTNSAGMSKTGDFTFNTIGKPAVTTDQASGLYPTAATLNGEVNPCGLATKAYFEYGVTPSYGGTTSVTLSPVDGAGVQAVTASLAGLQPGTTYHYRITGSNSAGVSSGEDVSFRTPDLFNYSSDPGAITITGYNGLSGTVVIPDKINGVPVKVIGDSAFLYCWWVTSVQIPSTVTEIAANAFYGCTSLNNLVIPASVTHFGDYCFGGCTGLTKLTLSPGLTTLQGSIFDHCTGLRSVVIPSSVTTLDGGVFAYCNGLASVTLPDGITAIGDSVFQWCTGLTSVKIPSKVTSIGDNAFYQCSRLASVTFPSTLTHIGGAAFSECTSLTGITLPSSLTSLDDDAFFDCQSLSSVVIPSSVTSLGMEIFANCSGLTSVKLANGITQIGAWDFDSCTSLTSVLIPASVTSIGDGAFSNCSSLLRIFFQGNAPTLGSNVFSHAGGTGDFEANVEYLEGTTGWGFSYGGLRADPIHDKDTVAPQISLITPKGASVSGSFDLVGVAVDHYGVDYVTVSLNGGAPRFAYTLELEDAVTGFGIEGVMPENGKNVIKIDAFDYSGNKSSTLTVKVNYVNKRPEFAGSYYGLLTPSSNVAPSNNVSGFIGVTVNASGLFTGKLNLGGSVLPISGIVDNEGVAHFNPSLTSSLSLVSKGTTPVGLGNLSLTLDEGNLGVILGSLNDNDGLLLDYIRADIAGFDPKKNPIDPSLVANYNVVFVTNSQSDRALSSYPQGYGVGALSINNKGIATLKGTLSDGTVVSASAPISPYYEWPCFVQLYGNGGSIAGMVGLNSGSRPSFSGNLLWFRPAGASPKYYGDGWPSGITVDIIGSVYTQSPFGPGQGNFPGLMGSDPINGNATLEFSNGRLTTTNGVLDKIVNIDPSSDAVSNVPQTDKSFSLKLTKSNGSISGSFLHTDQTKTAFKGIILQDDALYLKAGAYGFFLSTPQTATGNTGESGGVSLLAK